MASSSEQPLYCNDTTVSNSVFESPFTYPSKYPSEYFEKNNRQKPCVSLRYKDVDLDKLRPFVVKSIKDRTWISYDLAALFLWKYGERFKATLTKKWESFGVTICEPGEVGLSSIIDINFGTEKIPSLPEKDGMVSPEDDDWIASAFTSIYRINLALGKKSRLKLCKVALNKLLKNRGSGLNKRFDFPMHLHRSWTRNSNYIKIIVAYDMFLYKTRIGKYQFLRWGTINSRYRDCYVLSTWIDISNRCGFESLSDLKQWVFVDGVGKDMNRILKDGEEIDKPDSYMPYLYDLILSHKSPYSDSENPDLHAFLCTLGVYMGLKRLSKSEEFSGNRVNACFNGLIVAYVLRKMNCSANQSNNRGISFESDPVLEAVSTPDELLVYVKNKQPMDVINGPLDKFKKSIDASIFNSRPGSVGSYLPYLSALK